MLALLQRVCEARVEIDGRTVGQIGADLQVHLVNDGSVTIPMRMAPGV